MKYPAYAAILAVLLLLNTPCPGQERPKVGLVLSGGGARGLAHIGVLKMLDDLEIPVDCIAGTSMGGIVGALYAIGYSGREIEEIVRRTDWVRLFSDEPRRSLQPYLQKKEYGRYQLEFGIVDFKPVLPPGLVIGQNLFLTFADLIFPFNKVRNFDDLPKRYRCVAVNLQTGREFVIGNGPLDKAMRTTMAIPSIFSPVVWNDSLYIDGGILNNLPVDVVTAMGADIIIAVDVMGPQKEPRKPRSIVDVFEETLSILGMDRWRGNVEHADLYIQPDLDGFAITDFSKQKIRTIVARGDSAARNSRQRLIELRDSRHIHCYHDVNDPGIADRPYTISEIQITGATTMNFADIGEMLCLRTGAEFDPDRFRTCVDSLRGTGFFKEVVYELTPLNEREMKVAVRVWQLPHPVIGAVSIGGNEHHSDRFIYQLIGIRAGDRLDTEDLHRRILSLYSYGYFETIRYELEPLEDNSVHLKLYVTEKPLRRLRLGFRFDNYHKLVGVITASATDVPVTGLRVRNELQFAGLWKYSTRVSYPTRTMRMSFYPFFELHYSQLPLRLYDSEGNAAAEYTSRAGRAGAGFGMFISNLIQGEISCSYELIESSPSLTGLDPGLFPRYETDLSQVRASLDIDVLDDIYMPKQGFQIHAEFEGSYRRLGSPVPYERFSLFGDFYTTAGSIHTARFYFFTGRSSAALPFYKYFNQGAPETFAGMGWDQLYAGQYELARMEYRLQLHRFFYARLIGNAAFDIRGASGAVYGFGTGITFAYPLGSLELILSRGHTGFSPDREYRSAAYISVGAKF
ncbi:patatin-like phospholipase family protein [bacterium]|nr:patatin-like phospholipase family protein [bacterium]